MFGCLPEEISAKFPYLANVFNLAVTEGLLQDGRLAERVPNTPRLTGPTPATR